MVAAVLRDGVIAILLVSMIAYGAVLVVGGAELALSSDFPLQERAIGVGLAIIGGGLVGLFVFFGGQGIRNRWLARTGQRTLGTLSRVTGGGGGDDGPRWILEYVYQVDGLELAGKAESNRSHPQAGGDWEVGRRVLIAYDRERPARSVMIWRPWRLRPRG
jgi:hypothetical protein